MILGEKYPWYIAPSNAGVPDSESIRYRDEYNLHRQCFTVRYAMLNWLSALGQREGLWNDIVREHFKVHGNEIIKTVKRWAKQNPGIESYREQRGVMGAVRTHQPRGMNLLSELESLLYKGSSRW